MFSLFVVKGHFLATSVLPSFGAVPGWFRLEKAGSLWRGARPRGRDGKATKDFHLPASCCSHWMTCSNFLGTLWNHEAWLVSAAAVIPAPIPSLLPAPALSHRLSPRNLISFSVSCWRLTSRILRLLLPKPLTLCLH